ncbi:GNAT family N-acetyltransferase [Roseovarius sp. EL26]|uniref:GNAT family N-acetyltransferase n=1 Tax=Roseovarius sp. EL26 TaxID=2126672 RepID=UPI000EA3199D|nr:GNAT family N-acyltransferase [Roseovarius sp. EL26]
MKQDRPRYHVTVAQNEPDVRKAQRLRYQVFVEELGSDGPMVDHQNRLEVDQFDSYFDHLLLLDAQNGDEVVGVYRVLRDDQAARMGRYYSEDEYDLSTLKASGRKLMELGRSCLSAEHRGGPAMFYLWNALAHYVYEHKIEIMFGVASFHGTDPDEIAQSLSFLHHNHLAPENLRTRAQPDHYQNMNLCGKGDIDRLTAMKKIPSLIKAYLRLGGFVGDGAFVDHAFNTIDVCLIMDTEQLNEKQKNIYSKGVAA